jgi:protein arginine kinase activator
MQCELCKEKKATVHFKQVNDGAVQEMYICEACAARKGFDVGSPVGLSDFLFGIGSPGPGEKPPADDRACPACHMRRSDFRKTSRLGCPSCYETFADELAPMLEDMHRGLAHVGKVPAGATPASRGAALRQALEGAVAAQNFEEAARLRDLIRELSAEPVSKKAGRT